MANIATTGNAELFLQNHAGGLSYWSPASAVNPSLPAASCGAANPSGPQTSTNLVLDEQNTKISALHHAQNCPWPQHPTSSLTAPDAAIQLAHTCQLLGAALLFCPHSLPKKAPISPDRL